MEEAPATPVGFRDAQLALAAAAEPETVTNDNSAAEQLLSSCAKVMEMYGGPAQYLSEVLREACDGQLFLDWLKDTLPECDDTLYHHEAVLPHVTEAELASSTPICLHVSCLGFTANCSLKPCPGFDKCKTLMEEIVKDGFVTSSQPLFVLQHDVDCAPFDLPGHKPTELKPFGLAYLKGFARATTALMLLHRSKSLGFNSETEGLKPLFDSMARVWIQCLHQPSRVDEALQNMKLSARGSIRKANNTVECCFIIQNLMKCGLSDHSIFIKRWNQMSSRAFQIVGRKATALKLLFEHCPKDRCFLDVCFLFQI